MSTDLSVLIFGFRPTALPMSYTWETHQSDMGTAIRFSLVSTTGKLCGCNAKQETTLKSVCKIFKPGDHMEWNSEAGRVRGIIAKKLVSDVRFKRYIHHASKDEPEYLIKSDKTDHIAVHRPLGLRRAGSQKLFGL
jgi:Hypervirulence associated proteins TUDOR domain